MHNIINDSTLRFLRKQYKDWSEAKITEEVQMIWVKYLKDNKEKFKKQNILSITKLIKIQLL